MSIYSEKQREANLSFLEKELIPRKQHKASIYDALRKSTFSLKIQADYKHPTLFRFQPYRAFSNAVARCLNPK